MSAPTAPRLLVAATLPVVAAGLLAAPARADAVSAPKSQALAVLLRDHVVRAGPGLTARRVETVAARRPLTGVHTRLPVIGASGTGARRRLHVRLPGRPSGHTGWIADGNLRRTSTSWAIVVDLSARRVTVLDAGRVARRFTAIVGKPSTPTPRGSFFVEEAVALSPAVAGGPFALATSARSNVLQEFDGGPGQIALHGMDNLAGAPGTAVSHGCVRLGAQAIRWLAARIGAGVPVRIEG